MVLALLRQHTASLHEEVERRIDILSPQLTRNRYMRILQVFYAVFSKVEDSLEADCPAEFRGLWAGRARSGRLVEDLHFIGGDVDASLESEAGEPQTSDAGLWLGTLYVVEGSTLGGQVISRHLEKYFGFQQGKGYSFFFGHGAATKEKWQTLRTALEGHPGKNNQILAGAHHTFNQLNRCLHSSL